MSEGTLQPQIGNVDSRQFNVEYSQTLMTGSYKQSIKFSDFPRVGTLKSLFAAVKVISVVAEVRQDTLASESEGGLLSLAGHVFVAIIPTNKDTDSSSGSTSLIVNNVPNKQTFSLSNMQQLNSVFHFNLDGYEMDLAQDPRRGAGPVAWIGNSGVGRHGKVDVAICTVTWRLVVECSGTTPLWQ